MKIPRDQRGLTLIEVLIATLIVTIAGVGVALMFSTGQKFINVEGDSRVATMLNQQMVERLRVQGAGLTPDACTDGSGMCTDILTMTAGGTVKTYTRSFAVMCLNAFDYDRAAEGCLPAQYPVLAKLIVVCTVEGTFSRACQRPSGVRVTNYPASVVASQKHVTVLYSVLAPRF